MGTDHDRGPFLLQGTCKAGGPSSAYVHVMNLGTEIHISIPRDQRRVRWPANPPLMSECFKFLSEFMFTRVCPPLKPGQQGEGVLVRRTRAGGDLVADPEVPLLLFTPLSLSLPEAHPRGLCDQGCQHLSV